MLGSARDEVAPLLGRAAEQRLLTSVLDAVGDRGQALVLRGEPGIGKSRLLSVAEETARDRGMTVLRAAGVQSEAHLPFAGLHQLLRPVRERAVDLPPIQRDALDAAFGLTREVAPEQYRIAMASLNLVSDVAGDAPLLLVVEDAHWLDLPTADVLAFVARRIESDPVVLLVATRDGYPLALADAGLPEHRLVGLDDATAAGLLDAAAPDLPLAVRNRVLGEAAGNPLALLELPAVAGRSEDEPGRLPLTERLERAFAARVSELPEATRLVLLVAALSDEDAVGEILEAASVVAGMPLDLDAAEPAVEAALIDLDVTSIRFRHPLVRSAVRQGARVQQRRRVHEALAAALDADPDRRVWHRAALLSGTREELASELEEAGARARSRGAVDVAVTALQRAVELSAAGHRARRMFATAELAYERGRPDIAVPLLREMERLDLELLDVARVRFLSELMDARAIADRSRVAGLIAIAEGAGAEGDRELHHDLLWIAAARTWWASPDPDTRQLVVEAADRAGPPTPTDPRLVSIHAYADPHANEAKVLECLRDAEDGGVSGAVPAGYLAAAGLVIGAFYDSLTFCAIAIDSARAQGRLGVLPRLLATQAILAVRLPNWEIAIPAAEEARRLASELGQPIWLATAETAIAMIEAVRGDLAETVRATARAEQLALPLGANHLVALAQSGPIVAALAHGRHADAFRFAERLFDPGDPARHLQFACMAIGDLAEAAGPAGHAEAARGRLAEVEALVGDAPAEWIAINLRHARAVLAEGEREAALRFEEALGADLDRWPFWRGRLLLAYGRWLRRRRRVMDSRARLREARDVFDTIGASSWGDQARSELRASGERSRRRVPEARDQLTAQELQIAQLAAEGLSNREIGQRLYLSHRTISTHLYRVFPKLGITSRVELSAALASAR
jgi:DNA-binding CsgD family transcriptional regulator/tetratricopeptide (TPR) repeat protein